MNRITLYAGVAFIAITSTGCATIETVGADISERVGLSSGRTKDYPKISNTVKQGCGGGFTIGVGAAIAKGKRIEKVLRDGVIGGLIGCTIAKGLDKRRENFSNEADYFDTEIADAKHSNEQMSSLVSHTRKLTSESRSALVQLQAQREKKQLEQDAVTQARINARADLSWAESELETARSNLDFQESVSERMVSNGDSKRSNVMNGEIKQLESYIQNLEQEIQSLASINDSISQLTS